mmetsp:Transcript_36551/g.85446  ORF Transcript_36551/g.85446 Transcript_36551/m.85446 type:complete len:247 (-) Transcript_36551:133-873(-)
MNTARLLTIARAHRNPSREKSGWGFDPRSLSVEAGKETLSADQIFSSSQVVSSSASSRILYIFLVDEDCRTSCASSSHSIGRVSVASSMVGRHWIHAAHSSLRGKSVSLRSSIARRPASPVHPSYFSGKTGARDGDILGSKTSRGDPQVDKGTDKKFSSAPISFVATRPMRQDVGSRAARTLMSRMGQSDESRTAFRASTAADKVSSLFAKESTEAEASEKTEAKWIDLCKVAVVVVVSTWRGSTG